MAGFVRASAGYQCSQVNRKRPSTVTCSNLVSLIGSRHYGYGRSARLFRKQAGQHDVIEKLNQGSDDRPSGQR